MDVALCQDRRHHAQEEKPRPRQQVHPTPFRSDDPLAGLPCVDGGEMPCRPPYPSARSISHLKLEMWHISHLKREYMSQAGKQGYLAQVNKGTSHTSYRRALGPPWDLSGVNFDPIAT